MVGDSGEEGELAWETFPYTGLVKTYNTDKQAGYFLTQISKKYFYL